MARAHSQVIDADSKIRAARKLAAEKHQQQINDWVAEQEAHCHYVEDNDLSPANAERQLGQMMSSQELELRLAKICPTNVRFVNTPTGMRGAVLINPDGTYRKTICPYHLGYMPERSIMKVKTEWHPDTKNRHIDRKEMPKSRWDPEKKDFVFDGGARPGWKQVKVPYGEAKRGWRTALIHFVREGVLTPTQIEKAFGADNTPNWANAMGHKTLLLPW